MKATLLLAIVLLAVNARFPIFVYNSDLSRRDLFLDEADLVQRLTQQQKKINVFVIQTYFEGGESFIAKLRSKTEGMITFKVVVVVNR
jgi:hypothetical protein